MFPLSYHLQHTHTLIAHITSLLSSFHFTFEITIVYSYPFRPYYHGYPMVRGSLIKSQSVDVQANSSHGRKWPEIEKEHKNKAYAVNTITCPDLCAHLQIRPGK